MAKSKGSNKEKPNSERVCQNRRARHEFDILDELDCGIVLCGSEVKSIRNGRMSIEEAYARFRDGQLWLVGANISEYPQANLMNHEPKQTRKLLAHRRELQKFAAQAEEKGFTLVPTEVYFERGYVKVRIALAKGRKLHDKRDRIKTDSDRKEMRQAMMKRQ